MTEKATLRKQAANLRAKLRRGHRDPTPEEAEILAAWDGSRDKRGRKSVGAAGEPREDDDDTLSDPPTPDTVPDRPAPEEPVKEPEIRAKPPAPPKVRVKKSSSSKHWRDVYEHGSGDSRESACRHAVDLGVGLFVAAPLQKLVKMGVLDEPTASAKLSEIMPTMQNGVEVRPLPYDDAVCLADDVLPAGLAMPAGLMVGLFVGSIWLMVLQASRAQKRGAASAIPVTESPATEPEPSPEMSHQQNGSNGHAAITRGLLEGQQF